MVFHSLKTNFLILGSPINFPIPMFPKRENFFRFLPIPLGKVWERPKGKNLFLEALKRVIIFLVLGRFQDFCLVKLGRTKGGSPGGVNQVILLTRPHSNFPFNLQNWVPL